MQIVKAKMPPRALKQRVWKFLIGGVFAFFTITLGINLYIIGTTKSSIFTSIEQLPRTEFALLLGTDLLRADGSTNVHFVNRTDSAARVYAAGKARSLIVSGSKDNKGFNEVLGMEQALISKGVPEKALILDFEGVRTIESARHASQTFHLQKVLIITDGFHAPRSIFLCRSFSLDAVAFVSGNEPVNIWYYKHRLREYFARVKAVIDTSF
jgi:SanA protein